MVVKRRILGRKVEDFVQRLLVFFFGDYVFKSFSMTKKPPDDPQPMDLTLASGRPRRDGGEGGTFVAPTPSKTTTTKKLSFFTMAPSTILILGSLNADLISVTPRVPVAGETLTVSNTPDSPPPHYTPGRF